VVAPVKRDSARIGILAGLLILTAACGASPPVSPSPGAPSPTESPTESPTATPIPTLPSDAAPAELKGRWTQMGAADEVLLIINDTGYSITFTGFVVAGHIAVTGDQIAFSRIQSCPGTGTYQWAIDANGALTFTPIGEPDPCPRGGFLKGQTYMRE
jgi:hypothetical protein